MKSKQVVAVLRLSLLSAITQLLITSTAHAQVDPNDIKFDNKSITISFPALITKIEKPALFYSKVQNSFQYNYPAEIENVAGGYYYRGKMYCAWGKTPADGEYNAQIVLSGLQSVTMVKDEVSDITTPAGTAAKAYIRNYSLVYPVTVNIYNRKMELVKSVSFFSAKTPMAFRFVKEMAEPALSSINTPFASIEELANYEKASKHNKAAERFAYFEALRKADEIIKNYFGSFDYDVELGALVVRKKKAAAYKDLNEAADLLIDGIAAYKKNNLPLRDSLLKTALEKFKQLEALTEERMNATAKDALRYNILVCHVLLGDMATATDELKAYSITPVHKSDSYAGRSIANYMGIVSTRETLLKKDKLEF